ncbi:MAG TPA: FtsX-like permease family protein, partial [Pseudobdellovibrionaceae bacterium]|nr:FtsX-like permease family protein [Pseudobdellovibrionaceae bacterium]
IALRNTLKNWRKSLAAIASISVAFISLVLFQGYINDVNQMYEEGFSSRAMYGNLIIENKDAHSTEARLEPEKFHVTKEQQDLIQDYLGRHADEVKTRVRFLPVSGTVTNGKNSFIFIAMGYDLKEGAIMREPHWVWDTLYGVPLHLSEVPNGVVLGQSLGLLVGCLPENPQQNIVQNDGYVAEIRPYHCESPSLQVSTTTFSGQVNALDVNVVGLIDGGYKEIDQRWMKMPIEVAQTLLNTDHVRFMAVLLKDPEKIDSFADGMNRFFREKRLPLVAMNWVQHPLADLYKQTRSLLRVFHVFIVCIILVIVGLSVFNTMVKNVKERTREIGMLRSLGYRPRQIAWIFSLEAAGTCLVGVGIGFILAILCTSLVNEMKILYKAGLLSMPVIFRIAYDFPGYLLCAVLLVILSVVTSFFSVRSTLKTQISENLTHV